MKSTHMSAWDQEEYALGQRTPEMIEHVAKCAACRSGVEQLANGVALFRASAMEWSAECLETSLQAAPGVPAQSKKAMGMPALKWAMAAVLFLLVLVPLARLLFHKTDSMKTDATNAPMHKVTPAASAPLTDDALLEEVDQQVSDAVPDSMESLTHLVTTKSSGSEVDAVREGGQHVQRN
jgi:predicted anti-sigma-YlaC factor YlaD